MRKDSNAPPRERITDWVKFYKQSQLNYRMNALLAVLKSDGEQMLLEVLKELGLTKSVDLVKDASDNRQTG